MKKLFLGFILFFKMGAAFSHQGGWQPAAVDPVGGGNNQQNVQHPAAVDPVETMYILVMVGPNGWTILGMANLETANLAINQSGGAVVALLPQNLNNNQ